MTKDKKKILKCLHVGACLVIILFSFSIILYGCSILEKGENFLTQRFSSEEQMDSAVQTVDEFFNLIIAKDYESAYKYINSKDKNKKSKQDFIMEFSDVTDIMSIEINQVEVKNNIAVVTIDMIDSYDGERKMYKDIEISLIKEENESWKIVFWK